MMATKHQHVDIPVDHFYLKGILSLPSSPIGLVIFVHGSGSSRFSKRNQYVAELLQERRLATLLFDLLTEDEEVIDNITREHRFNISLLTDRLLAVTKWIYTISELNQLSIGYFGASTGAAAALQAAAKLPADIKAVVSRGGRPDLAGELLMHVETPTLLIVGGNDEAVIDLNKKAMAVMHCPFKLEIITGATHLFEEPGTLQKAASHARNWFVEWLK